MKTILDVEPVGTRLEVPRLARSPRQRDFTAFDVDLIDSVVARPPHVSNCQRRKLPPGRRRELSARKTRNTKDLETPPI